MRVKLLLIVAVLAPALCAGTTTTTDLQQKWMVSTDEGFESFQSDKHAGGSTVYFELDLSVYRNGFLEIFSRQGPSLFINGELVATSLGENVSLSIDSLRSLSGSSRLWIGIHQEGIHPGSLSTRVRQEVATTNIHESLRQSTYFRDFVVAGSVMVLLLTIVVLYLNPKLASDYFSFTKLFSSLDRDDIQNIRVVSSTNLLFVTLLCVSFSMLAKIIFHFLVNRLYLGWYFWGDTFIEEVVQWIRLISLIFVVVLVKVTIIYWSGKLFQLGDVWKTHLFNWTRLTLLATLISLVLAVLYFLAHGQNPAVYQALLLVFMISLALSVIVIFSKVARRTSFSWFHIFSYLCATELIPLLISIKLTYQ